MEVNETTIAESEGIDLRDQSDPAKRLLIPFDLWQAWLAAARDYETTYAPSHHGIRKTK